MSADQIVAGILVVVIGGAFLLNALTDDGPPEHRSPYPPPTWSEYLGEDLPPMPVAQVVDPPALEWDVVTGEVVEPEPHRIEPNIRRLGAGR